MEDAHAGHHAYGLTIAGNTRELLAQNMMRGWTAGLEVSWMGLHADLRDTDMLSLTAVGKRWTCLQAKQSAYGSHTCGRSPINAAAYRCPSDN